MRPVRSVSASTLARGQGLPVVAVDEEEVVASPRDIAGHGTEARHVYVTFLASRRDGTLRTLTAPIIVQGRDDDTDRRLDAVHARRDAPPVRERRDDADRAMPTHPKIADIIEEDHTRRAG